MVAFSYTHEHIVASSHDSVVSVWDMRMITKTPLKSHKTSSGLDFRTINLEFDQLNGFLLVCFPKKVYLYTEDNFSHPLEISSSKLDIHFRPIRRQLQHQKCKIHPK
jgi:hypothetical protein